MHSSPLRQLARAYFEGHLERGDYVEQRRRLIEALDNPPEQAGNSASRAPPLEVPRVMDATRPDSNALATALERPADGRPEAVAPALLDDDNPLLPPVLGGQRDPGHGTETLPGKSAAAGHAEGSVQTATTGKKIRWWVLGLVVLGCLGVIVYLEVAGHAP